MKDSYEMTEQLKRSKRINANLLINKLPSKFQNMNANALGSVISDFIHHVFVERKKSAGLNWCFATIKRVKIFLQIFHADCAGTEIYKEEIAKNLPEYSYKTIAKIIDDGIAKNYFILLAADSSIIKDAKVKNIRPSEALSTDFLNLSLEILSYIDKKKPK
jgi:hypothetical protein